MTIFEIKRVYDPPAASDGQRVLVDRIWPPGLRKSDLDNAVWIENISPSSELRKWFGHRPERREEFHRRYLAKLDPNRAVEELCSLSKKEAPSDFAIFRSRYETQPGAGTHRISSKDGLARQSKVIVVRFVQSSRGFKPPFPLASLDACGCPI